MVVKKLFGIVCFLLMFTNFEECLGTLRTAREKICWEHAEVRVPTALEHAASLGNNSGSFWPWKDVMTTFRKIVYATCCDTPEAWIEEGLISKSVLWIYHPPMPNPSGKKELSPEEFRINYSRVVIPALKKAIKTQDPSHIFQNWQGCMIGSGELWFDPTHAHVSTFNETADTL